MPKWKCQNFATIVWQDFQVEIFNIFIIYYIQSLFIEKCSGHDSIDKKCPYF